MGCNIWCSVAGIYNQKLVVFHCKKQHTVDVSAFGAEFVAIEEDSGQDDRETADETLAFWVAIKESRVQQMCSVT